MTRRTVPLTVDHLSAVVGLPCRECLCWELDAVSRARLDREERAARKATWVAEVLRDWGSCGRTVLVDAEPVGVAIYAPPALVPGTAALPTAPPSPDAVVLTTVWVAPEHRGGGLGRLLVQGMARDLVTRGFPAVETFGAGRVSGGSCRVPAEFLGRVGFTTQRAHPTCPRLRMELRSTLAWRDEVEQALERLWGVVRPAVSPTQMKSASSLRRAAFGLAPTIDFTTSPPW